MDKINTLLQHGIALAPDFLYVRSVLFKNFFAEFNTLLRALIVRFVSEYHYGQILSSSCPADKFIVIHFGQHMMPCQHFAVFIQLLAETCCNSVISVNS